MITRHVVPSSQSQRGFTLVETLVAITVLLIAILGPFQVVQQSLLASYTARDQLIASSLAEEAIEYVRSIRDDNYLYNFANPSSPRSWMYGLNGLGGPNCFAANGCTVDPTQDSISACSTSCLPLKLSSNGIYTQSSPSGATATRFTRKVVIESISATEVKITTTVTWNTNRIPFSLTVTDTLFNWL